MFKFLKNRKKDEDYFVYLKENSFAKRLALVCFHFKTSKSRKAEENFGKGKSRIEEKKGFDTSHYLLLPVGLFPELNHTQFTWFGNLPTPRSYWFVLMKLTNNTNKGGGDKTLSTQLYSLKLSLFFSVLSSLCVSHAALSVFFIHTQLYIYN
jgi:hypothetical protein